MRNAFSTKVITQKILPLALPMAGTQLITIGSGFLCMAMLAALGHDVLAASALIFSTQMSVIVIGMSFLFSLSILVGHAYGAKDYLAAGQFIQQGWTLAILIAIPIMFFFGHIGSIFIFFGQSKQITGIIQTFFHAYNWRVIPVLLAACNQQLCYGTRKQKLDIITSVLGVIILLISAYLLIFGKMGLPQLGVAGLGYAMALQAWFYFIFTTLFFYFNDYFKAFHLFRYRVHLNLNRVVQMFKVGWPICIQISGEMLSFFVTATLIGWLGVNALAAYQVVIQYLFLILIPIFALSQASGVLVGQACGSKQFAEIKTLGISSASLAVMISIVVGLIFILFPHILASMYLDVKNPINAETVHWIVLLFGIIACSQLFDAVRNVLTGSLRGLFDTKFSMIVGLLVIWFVGIPLGYLLAFTLHLGVIGIAIGSLCGILFGAIIITYRWFSLTKNLQ